MMMDILTTDGDGMDDDSEITTEPDNDGDGNPRLFRY